MNYSLIRKCDIANGPGVRISLFVSGCTHHCPGCFQPETWDFNYGERFTKQTQEKILELLKPDYISGLTILGGEPMESKNILGVCELISQVKRFYPDKTVWLYSGYTFEQLSRPTSSVTTNIIRYNIMRRLDILVDGPFIEEKKDLRLKFCGSSNQRLIDLRKRRQRERLSSGKEKSDALRNALFHEERSSGRT